MNFDAQLIGLNFRPKRSRMPHPRRVMRLRSQGPLAGRSFIFMRWVRQRQPLFVSAFWSKQQTSHLGDRSARFSVTVPQGLSEGQTFQAQLPPAIASATPNDSQTVPFLDQKIMSHSQFGISLSDDGAAEVYDCFLRSRLLTCQTRF